MTTVTVYREGERITRLTCSGHAGEMAAGENIVCAAVSILVQNCVNAIEQVAGLMPPTAVDEAAALISVGMPKGTPAQEHDAQTILRTTVIGLTDISQAYPTMVKLHTLNGRKTP